MAQDRVRIADVADSLGLSTATVSKVIHGKTEKISDETVKRVQQELERSGYIPNMAAILLARNNSRIIGVVVNDNEKYEGRVLEDGFVMTKPGSSTLYFLLHTVLSISATLTYILRHGSVYPPVPARSLAQADPDTFSHCRFGTRPSLNL